MEKTNKQKNKKKTPNPKCHQNISPLKFQISAFKSSESYMDNILGMIHPGESSSPSVDL